MKELKTCLVKIRAKDNKTETRDHTQFSSIWLQKTATSLVKKANDGVLRPPINLPIFWTYNIYTITFSSLYTHFYACVTSVDPDQLAHSCHLIRICTGLILVRNNLINQKVGKQYRSWSDGIDVQADLDLHCSPTPKNVSMDEMVSIVWTFWECATNMLM